jgi:integrase
MARPGGYQRKRAFPRRIDADRFITKLAADLLHGDYVDPNDPITLREYVESWRLAQVHRPATQAHVETNLRRHVYPYFGQRRLATIRPSEIQAWVTRLTGKLSPATVQVFHGIVAAIFKAAIRDRRVRASPCESTTLPKKLPREIVPLDTAVVEHLIEAVPHRYRALIVLAAGTGTRQGECFGLCLNRIDFLRRTVRVDATRPSPPSGPLSGTAKDRRLTPDDSPTTRRRYDFGRAHQAVRGRTSRWPVFTDEDGHALRRTMFSREIWRPAVKTKGIGMQS